MPKKSPKNDTAEGALIGGEAGSLLGPWGLVLGLLIGGIAGAVLGNYVYDALSADGSAVEGDSEAALKDTAGKYGYGTCLEAAQAMKEELTRKKQSGSTIILTWTPLNNRATRYIWSDLAGREVGTNPIHVGVCYNGIVYCNVHPDGLPKSKWIQDFNYPGVKSVSEIPF